MKDLAPDCSPLTGGSNHRDCPRIEEELQSINGGNRFAPLKPFDCFAAEGGGEGDMKLACCCSYFNGKSGFSEHVEHRMICSYHFGCELLNSISNRYLGKLAEQDGAESTPTKIIGDRERDFGSTFIKGRIKRMADDAFFHTAKREQAESMIKIDFTMGFSGKSRVLCGREEPEPTRFV